MHSTTKRLLISSVLLAAALEADAQAGRVITGIVKEQGADSKAQPLIGATVATLDNKTGTQTDENGNFSLSVSGGETRLVVSYTGYSADTVNITGDKLDIRLNRPRSLKEVKIVQRQASTTISMLDPIKTERIGERELLKAACCNLSESFETTPSVDVAFTDAVSGYKQIQMLGLAGPYTVITRENIPDTRGFASVTGLTFTPGTWIEGMQLSKGTGSVVNGFESVAGQINVELRKPFEEQEPRWLLNMYQNTQGRTEGNVVYRKELNKSLSTNLMLHGKSQWSKIDQNNDGFMDQPLDKQFVGLNRWFYFAPNGLEIQGGVKGTYVTNTGGQLSYEDGTEQKAGNPWGYLMDIRRGEGWAKIGKMFRDKPGTSMGLQLSALYHDQDGRYGNRMYDAEQKSFYANYIFQTIIDNTNHILKTGASMQADQYDEHLNGTQYARNEYVPGAFAEYAYSYLDKFNLVAGIRGDYHNLFGAFATPRLHVRYAPFKKTVMRASVGRAQRTANIFAENMGIMASNRNFMVLGTANNKPYGLDAEVAWNTGLNLTQKFMLDYRDGSFSVDYYYTHFENQVVVDAEDPTKLLFYNLNGPSYAHSFQAQLDYELMRKLDLRLAYRWYDVKSTYSAELKARPLVATHRAFANIGYETRNSWKFDYTIQWVGAKRVPSLLYHHSGTQAAYQSPSFVQMNAQISKSWNDVFEVYLGGENLTNYMQHMPIVGGTAPFEPGFDASMIWGPVMGRNVYAGFRYKIR
ncbi:MAG: TonB-dependent receptor [Sphingobacteriales bacterium]|nr:MAG: TonB-dependent receptor [Sphingobacteriales bacterium]